MTCPLKGIRALVEGLAGLTRTHELNHFELPITMKYRFVKIKDVKI
jgi:hypothetical protein